MYNSNAVRNIVSAHVSKINRESRYYLKVVLYSLAFAAMFVLTITGHPGAGLVVSGVIALLTLIFLGLPIGVFEDEFQRRLVPDAIYVAIKDSDAIEPGLMNAIRYSLSPDLIVSDLVEVERKYHQDKKITSAPGYRGLGPVDPDEPETN